MSPIQNNMNLLPRQSQQQQQQQQLSARQLQNLELLALPRLDLETLLTENPLIEIEEPQEEYSPDLPASAPAETEDESLYEAEAYEQSDELVALETLENQEGLEEFSLGDEENDSDTSSDESDVYEFALDEAPENDFLDYTAAPETDFREELLLEINVRKDLDEKTKQLCAVIISQLDDHGLLRAPLADVAQSNSVSLDECANALRAVQELDPPGIGARSVPECWEIQLKRLGRFTPPFEVLLKDHLEDLQNNRLNNITKVLKITMEELQEMLRRLAELRSFPVQSEVQLRPEIYPEVEIFPTSSGTYAARLMREKRSFKLSPYAETQAADAGADFLEKVREGKMLLEALAFRKSTILRLAELIIDTQTPFLDFGAGKLRPFTMKQGAEALNLSESTISRAAAEKYVKTPHGVLPFKYFFTAGYVSDEGEKVSRTADMELLKKLIEEEDKRKPLSDEKLSQLLNEAGHPVARRTVVKYREKMNIPNSSLRKEFF